MSARVAGNYLSEMVDRIAEREGRDRALTEVSRATGLSYWAVDKLARGKVKTIITTNFLKVRAAYLDWCLREIGRMQHSMEAAEDDDLLGNLEAQVLALRQKVRAKQAEVRYAAE